MSSTIAFLIAKKPLKSLASVRMTWRGVSCTALAQRYALQRSSTESSFDMLRSPESAADTEGQTQFHVRRRVEEPSR